MLSCQNKIPADTLNWIKVFLQKDRTRANLAMKALGAAGWWPLWCPQLNRAKAAPPCWSFLHLPARHRCPALIHPHGDMGCKQRGCPVSNWVAPSAPVSASSPGQPFTLVTASSHGATLIDMAQEDTGEVGGYKVICDWEEQRFQLAGCETPFKANHLQCWFPPKCLNHHLAQRSERMNTVIEKCAQQRVLVTGALEGLELASFPQPTASLTASSSSHRMGIMEQPQVAHFVLSMSMHPLGLRASAQRLSASQSIKRRYKIPEKWHILAIMINKVYSQLL